MAVESIIILGCTEADRQVMWQILASRECEAGMAADLAAGCELLTQAPCDLLVLDAAALDRPGQRAAKDIRAMLPELPIVVAGPDRTAATFALMLKIGATDFLHTPVDGQQFRMLLERIDEHSRLLDENEYLWDELARVYGCDGLIRKEPGMAEVVRQAARVARTDAAVLIQGEEGTEKELVAQYIHRSSPRRAGPFIRFNCRSISAQHIARELFGWQDAHGKHPGRIELAADGTLYIEEIAALPLPLQGRLLRVIEDAQYQREGGGPTITSRARVIASTSTDPYEKIRSGELREDLFFRLNIVPIFLPPLRKRSGDIPLLADHFARKFGAVNGAVDVIGRTQFARMRQYCWPGNVSELEGEVRLAVLRAGGLGIGPEDPWQDEG